MGAYRSRWNRARLVKVTLLCWVVTFGFGAVWSLSTPLWATPDAPAHDLMAYHAVRDITIERTDVYANGVTSNAITVAPAGLFRSALSSACYRFNTTPADCISRPTNDDTPVDFVNPAGRNMPTYYLATGWPSLLSSTKDAIWAERLAAVAISSFFLSWAASAALTCARRSIALSGVAVATTPMVLYLSGAVNPNALEITAGMALAACSVVFLRARDDPWLAHVMFRRSMIAATVMVTTRMLAPVWVLAWAAAFCIVASRSHWRHVFSRRGVRWTLLPVAGAAFNVVWTITSGVTEYQSEPKYTNSLWANLGLSKDFIDAGTIQQQVGFFGWLDTPMHPGWYITYAVVVVVVVLVASTRLSRRELAAVGLLALAQYLLPIVLQALQYNTNGPVWQGRYALPLTTAVPIFALMLASMRERRTPSGPGPETWLLPAALGVLALVHVRALTVDMQRNVSGLDGPSFLQGGVWQPPFGALSLLAVHALLVLAVMAVLTILTVQDRRSAVAHHAAVDSCEATADV